MRDEIVQDVATSPLAETLERVDPEKYYFGMKLGVVGESWRRADSLARDDGEFLAAQMERTRTKWDLNNRDTAISLTGGYAWQVGGPAAVCYVLSRRVPDISPENLALRFDEDGGIAEAAVIGSRFAALPSDPAASHPDAVVLDSEAALLGWLRVRLEAGIEPLVVAVRSRMRISRRTLWSRAADLVTDAFLTAGFDTPDQARYAADADAFISTPGSPLRGNTGFFVVERDGRRGAFMTRAVCCHGYKDPEHGYCNSCPMLSQEERERLAVEELVSS